MSIITDRYNFWCGMKLWMVCYLFVFNCLLNDYNLLEYFEEIYIYNNMECFIFVGNILGWKK